MSALSEEDEMVKLYTKLSRREMEYNTYIAEATEEGYSKGHEKGYNEGHEKGIEQGIEKGIEQGIEQGIEKGIKQNNIDVAKKMLEEKLPLETISKITGLSTEEVLKLK